MLRLRRYRFFAIFAVFAIIALYHFRSLGDLDAARQEWSNLAHKSKPEDRPSEYEPQQVSSPDEEGSGKAKKPPSRVDDAGDRDDRPRKDDDEEIPWQGKEPATSPADESDRDERPREGEDEEQATPMAEKPGETPTTTPPSTSVLESTPTDPTSGLKPDKTSVRPGRPGKEETQEVIDSGVIDTSPATSGEKERLPKGPAAPVTGPGVTEQGSGRFEVIDDDDTMPKIHWSPLPEHFPLPSGSLTPIPTGKPKSIPRIQHQFEDESQTERLDRTKKLDEIKSAFQFSWSGYRKNAWMQDELSPVSGRYRNPFCGWAATMVDSLDTLWIMGLKSEFEEAVKAVEDIDFTTSIRNDIPLFETTIRYLGGLIGAYDVSGGKHKGLIRKAVELADILMGAFDTPNRMPMTYYLWKPTFASQPHRARTRVVLAELGSLSVEFTRLAQITKEAKFYDAIARITNELQEWQNNTRIPGLFPKHVDASGCKKPDVTYDVPTQITLQTGSEQGRQESMHKDVAKSHDEARVESNRNKSNARPPSADGQPKSETRKGKKKGDFPDSGKIIKSIDLEEDEIVEAPTPSDAGPVVRGKDTIADTRSKKAVTAAQPADKEEDVGSRQPRSPGLEKRQIADEDLATASAEKTKPDCEAQGLASPPYTTFEEFTLGGMADSLYEYLPKQYMLLGGLESSYQSMAEFAMDASKKHLLYRPMIDDEKRNILFPGQISVTGWKDTDADVKPQLNLAAEGTHLGCFVGGMFGVGAKIFDREEDLDIARRLTDGCVWAYESTPTGIMPEGFEMLPCASQETCPFNETRWFESLDFYKESRISNFLAQQEQEKLNRKTKVEGSRPRSHGDDGAHEAAPLESLESPAMAASSSSVTQELAASPATADSSPESAATIDSEPGIIKRQLDDLDHEEPTKTSENLPRFPERDATSVGDDRMEVIDQSAIDDESTIVTDSARNPSETSLVPSLPDVPQYTPPPIPTTEEVAQNRIRDEHLPSGMVRVNAAKYILRPEAIESVFIMYRITGEDYWRKKGWKMFEAIRKYTSAAFGASAISDVMAEAPVTLDEMESFWLAETLKYFYLLFSDPELVSLDDYIL